MHIVQCLPTRLGSVSLHSPHSGFDIYNIKLQKRFVLCSGKWQAIKAVPCGRWTLARVRFVTSLFHCLHELDRQMQPS